MEMTIAMAASTVNVKTMQIAPDLQLPGLPEVTLKALDACEQGSSYRQLSDLIGMDTALVSRILALANSALYGQPGAIRSLEQALTRLGPQRIYTLILTSGLGKLPVEPSQDQWQQLRDFWRHSLTTALTARTLATLTRYPTPDEAFLLGILHNIGELIALAMPEGDARQQVLNDQAELGARLVTDWGLGALAGDALRYQQAAPDDIIDGGHLAKLVNVSSRLALRDAAGIAAARTVLGLEEELTQELCLRIEREVATLANSLGVPLDTPYDPAAAGSELKASLIGQAMVRQAIDFAGQRGATDFLAGATSSLALIAGNPVLCFELSRDQLILLASSAGAVPLLSIDREPARSLLTRACTSRQPLALGDHPPGVLDRQLMSLLGAASLMAVPVWDTTDCRAVFVVACDHQGAGALAATAARFARHLGTELEQDSHPAGAGDGNIAGLLARESLRRQVHEINNPLTIIRQSIFQLQDRLKDPQAREQLEVIREEIDRAGNLLAELGQGPSDRGDQSSSSALNTELQALGELLQTSLFSAGSARLSVATCSNETMVAATPATIRQIVINLVRNAAEGLAGQDKAHVSLRTSAPVWQDGRQWVELEIEDNGAGLPEQVQQSLFRPVASTKGAQHSGLGLSIVKQLVDDMEGIIGCRTGRTGTLFRILFPVASGESNA